jgi:hypothetical protein
MALFLQNLTAQEEKNMRLFGAAAAFCLCYGALALAQSNAAQQDAPDPGDLLVLRGCVAPGAESGTFVMNNVVEVDSTGAEKPAPRLVSSILYWFKDASGLKPHVGKRVEVAGKIDGLEQSEVELKEGPQADGSFVVEVEGPGNDVVASTKALPGVAGTTGSATPEKDDVKTTLIKVTMGHVKEIAAGCA